MSDEEIMEEGLQEGSFEPEVLVDKPLTKEIAAKSLSMLKRLGYGLSHAYIKFTCVHQGITDISILATFPFLRYVTLSENYIEDISPLSSAEYLMYLKVDHNRILESGNLKSLHYLQYFDLSHNKVGSTDFIYHGRLKQLKMNYNEIATLKGVNAPPMSQFKLRELETLELRGNRIQSTDGLGYLHDLKVLYLAENFLTTVEDLAGMRGLVRLHLRDNHIKNLDGFREGLENLEYLNLRGNQIKRWHEVKKLRSLGSLRTLVLSDNPISEQDFYRQTVLGMMPYLLKLDKDSTSKDEIDEAMTYFDHREEQEFEEEDENHLDTKMNDEDMNQEGGVGESKATAPTDAVGGDEDDAGANDDGDDDDEDEDEGEED